MIIFGGLAAAATLLGDKWIEKEEHKSSKLNAKTVEEALDAYRKVNKRLPCPADPALNPGDAGFGEELYTGGACAGTLPAAAGGTGNAVVGVLPTKTLGLGENLVTDNWGNRFDYYLDKRMATENAFSVYPPASSNIGDIEVRDESGSVRTDKAIYAIVSRGANERGALTRAGTLKNAATSDLNEQANNHFNASGTASAKDNVVVQASPGKDFDDIVMFKTRAMMGTGGKLAVPQGCDSQTANWTQGANSCTGSVSAMADGDTATITDSGAPTTGQVTASCNNGTIAYSGEACTTGVPCGAGTVNWTVGAKNCSASVPATSSGVDVAASDTTAPQTGAATATCTNGVWSTSSTTCFNQCTATTHLWSDPDGSDCNGNVPLTQHGSAPVVASTGPGNGNVTATCNDGVFAYSSATCTDDADCLATSLPWTVGANSCSGTIAQTANAATATATDASHAVSPGGSGTANFTCNNGTWNTTPSAATCNAQCAANTQNWTVSGAPCSSAYTILNHDPATNVPLNDASAPSTGTANIRCNNGVVTLQSGSTCSTTCPASSASWTQGAHNCTASYAAVAGGASIVANDTTGPDTGSVTLTCNNATGAVAQSGATCSAFVNCPAGTASWTVNDNCAAQTVSWTVGGRTCSGNALATNDGATTATITDATQALAPGGHGTATFTCNDGTFDVNAGATCESQCNVAPFGVVNDNASVTGYSSATVACGGSCAAVAETRTCNNGTLSGTFANASCSVTACAGCATRPESWTVGANSCTGTTPALTHGGSISVTDSTGTTGAVTMTCTDGTLAQSGGTCSAGMPGGVGVCAAGSNLYIATSSANRVRRVNGATGIITTVAGTGTNGATGDGGPATSARLDSPSAVSLDSSGNLFIVDRDNSRIRRVDAATGIITNYASASTYPEGAAVDSSNNLFFSITSGSARIRRKDAVTGTVTTVVGSTSGFTGDGGPATAARLSRPHGVAIDTAGNLFISDFNNHRIRRVDGATGIITTVAGSGATGTGMGGFSGDGGPATSARLNAPEDVRLDSSGNIFIADSLNHRVRRVDAVTGIITTVAGTGTAGFSGNGGPATSAQLNEPVRMVIDSSGNLFITDKMNMRIRRVDGATGIITTVAGNGSAGHSGDGGPATSAGLYYPGGIACR
ncbi:MAG: hypothetical protein C0519_04585 [Hyphomicrobium sp.]|nr:hypothetical protein [Hyphomicrobium sp.]